MITNNDKIILEAYNSVTTNCNKFQSFTESFWDEVYETNMLITEEAERQDKYDLLEDQIFWHVMCLTEAEIPEFFRVLEEGWKDKLKAVGGALKKGAKVAGNVAKKGAVATGKYLAKDDNVLHKAKDLSNKVGGAVAKGAVKVAKGTGKAAMTFAKEVIPDDWQKKGKEVIAKVKAKLTDVYDKKIKPALEKVGQTLKTMGNAIIPPAAVEAIIKNAKENPTVKKVMGKMGGDGEKTIGNYLMQTLKDNKGSLIAATAALAFPPANMWIGAKIAATVLIPIIMDGIVAYQKFKEDSVKEAIRLGAKNVGDYQTMKKEGKLKKIKVPKELQAGQPNMIPA